MKTNIKTVTTGNNNYVNLKFKTKEEADAVRAALRLTSAAKRVDPYHEAVKTVRVYG